MTKIFQTSSCNSLKISWQIIFKETVASSEPFYIRHIDFLLHRKQENFKFLYFYHKWAWISINNNILLAINRWQFINTFVYLAWLQWGFRKTVDNFIRQTETRFDIYLKSTVFKSFVSLLMILITWKNKL